MPRFQRHCSILPLPPIHHRPTHFARVRELRNRQRENPVMQHLFVVRAPPLDPQRRRASSCPAPAGSGCASTSCSSRPFAPTSRPQAPRVMMLMLVGRSVPACLQRQAAPAPLGSETKPMDMFENLRCVELERPCTHRRSRPSPHRRR